MTFVGAFLLGCGVVVLKLALLDARDFAGYPGLKVGFWLSYGFGWAAAACWW